MRSEYLTEEPGFYLVIEEDLESENGFHVINENEKELHVWDRGHPIYPSEMMEATGCKYYTLRTSGVRVRSGPSDADRCDIIIDESRNVIQFTVIKAGESRTGF
jgi:hypothetical protein